PNEHPAWNEWYGGREMGLQYGFTTIGIAQTDAEMKAHLAKVDQSQIGSNWGAGDIMYADVDGNGKIDRGTGLLGDTGDWQVIGNSSPHYVYGISVDLAYKGFDLSFFLQGVGQGQQTIGAGSNLFYGMNGIGEWFQSGFTSHLDFWRPADDKGYFGPNPNAYFPRLIENTQKNTQEQTRFMQDVSYLRMKNVQIGYTLPEVLTQKFYCKQLRFFVSADNVFTITKLNKAFDPETINGEYGTGKAYPLSTVISAGLSITF
ncbi:MAG: SusC/RagA family protein, partial [Mucinivorans sp.]